MATRGTFVTRSRARTFAIALVCAVVLLGVGAMSAYAASPLSSMPDRQGIIAGGENGSGVKALAHDTSGNEYLGGSFSWVGPNTGTSAVVASPTAELIKGVGTNGTVYCSVADGQGGAYLGGAFRLADGQYAYSLAHVLADGSADPLFQDVVFSGTVKSMALQGDTLYLSGAFDWVSDDNWANLLFRKNVAAFDVTTRTFTDWSVAGINGDVDAIAADADTIYIGGPFTNIGEVSLPYLAAIDAETGLPLPWYPVPNARTRALELVDGELYVGGDFTSLDEGDVACSRIARYDTAALTGAPESWRVDETISNGGVYSISVSGNYVAIGGGFSSVSGEYSPSWAILSAISGNLYHTSGDSGESFVNVVKYIDGYLYVGGVIDVAGGPAVLHDAFRLTPLGFTDYMWNPGITDRAQTFCPMDSGILVGGEFLSAGATWVDNLAKVLPDGTVATSWRPQPNGEIDALAVAGDTLFFGGNFDEWNQGASSTEYLGACSLDAATPEAPDLPNPYGTVRALEYKNSKVYVGGSFGVPTNLFAVDPVTGALDDQFDVFIDGGMVNAIEATSDRVYVGGSDMGVYSESRNLVAYAADTGALDEGFAADTNGEVYGMCLSPDQQTLYLAGGFSSVSEAPRGYAAAVDAATGEVTDWDPGPDQTCYAVYCSGNSIFLGGSFSTLQYADGDWGPIARGYQAELTPRGVATGWCPLLSDNPYVFDINRAHLWAGGSFATAYDSWLDEDELQNWAAQYQLGGWAARPVIDAPLPNGDNGWFMGPSSPDVTITAEAVDDSIYYRFDPDDEWQEAGSEVVVNPPEGTSTVEAYVRTADGFASSISSRSFKVDTIAPVMEAVFNGGSDVVTQSAQVYPGIAMISIVSTSTESGSGLISGYEAQSGIRFQYFDIPRDATKFYRYRTWYGLALGADPATYEFTLAMQDAAGNETTASADIYVDVWGPPRVGDPAAWFADGAVEVTWTPQAEDAADHFGYAGARVIKSAYGSAPGPYESEGYTIVYEGDQSHFTDPDVDPDVIYYYTIYPMDEYNNFGDPVTVATIDPSGRVPTSIDSTSSVTRVGYNGEVSVTGTFTIDALDKKYGAAVPLPDVYLWSSTDGIHWTNQGPATYIGDRKFRASMHLTQNTYLDLRFPGSDTFLPSTSDNVIWVASKAKLTTPTVQRVGSHKYKISGSLYPKHTTKTSVVLAIYKKSGTHWWTYRNVTVYLAPGKSYYATTVKLPSHGSWRVKPWHSDDSHLYTTGTTKGFTVH